MIRLRRAAPQVLGALLVALGLGLTMTASAQSAQGLTLDSALDRVGPVLAVLGVIVAVYRGARAAVRDVAQGVVEAHDATKDAHQAAAHENHAPMQASMHNLDLGMAAILGKLNVIAETVKTDARLLDDLNERVRVIEEEHAAFHGMRDPGATRHKCRADDSGADYTPPRGKQ